MQPDLQLIMLQWKLITLELFAYVEYKVIFWANQRLVSMLQPHPGLYYYIKLRYWACMDVHIGLKPPRALAAGWKLGWTNIERKKTLFLGGWLQVRLLFFSSPRVQSVSGGVTHCSSAIDEAVHHDFSIAFRTMFAANNLLSEHTREDTRNTKPP